MKSATGWRYLAHSSLWSESCLREALRMAFRFSLAASNAATLSSLLFSIFSIMASRSGAPDFPFLFLEGGGSDWDEGTAAGDGTGAGRVEGPGRDQEVEGPGRDQGS